MASPGRGRDAANDRGAGAAWQTPPHPHDSCLAGGTLAVCPEPCRHDIGRNDECDRPYPPFHDRLSRAARDGVHHFSTTCYQPDHPTDRRRPYGSRVEASRLAAVPLFADLEDTDLTVIAAAAREVEVDDGHTLATQGDFGHALFAIESGTAEVSADGEKRGTLGPGDVFGEIAVLAAGHRTASVVATSPMRLIALFKRDVWALEQQSPQAAERLRSLALERRDSRLDPA